MKYKVDVFVLKMNKEGNSKSESFDFNFEGENLMEQRKTAIAKVKELESFFNNDMTTGSEFSTPLEAKFKDFKNFKAYTIDLFFVNDDEDEYQLYAEPELTYEALEVEASYYEDNYARIEVESPEGYDVEVLQDDLDFFLG